MNRTKSTFGERFGSLVKAKREQHGWSLANLAIEVFGDDGSQGENRKGDIHKLESGNTAKPRASTVKRYCDALFISQDEVDKLRTPEQMPTVTQMRRLLAERDYLKSGNELTELQVIGLAERISESVPDFETAIRELERALSIAEELKLRSTQRSDHPEFVDQILSNIQSLNDQDRPDVASTRIERALEQIEAQRGLLLDALVAQHMLRQDANSTANALIQRIKREENASNFFAKLRGVQSFYLEKFMEGQSKFMGDMAIVLAERLADFAANPNEEAHANSALASTLELLGKYEDSVSRMQQSIRAYKSALQLIDRRDRPIEWAISQNNLGTALLELSKREDSPERLNDAVTAYQAALQVRTKDAMPVDWAATKNNLGAALQELGTREDSPERLDAAVTAYQAALQVYTKDAMPVDWAITQFNLSSLHLTLFNQTADATHLDTAQTHLDNAVEIFARAEASQYLKRTAELQTDINTRRAGL